MLITAMACLWMAVSVQAATASLPLTEPKPSLSSTDVLLRTVLSDLLREGHRELAPDRGAVIIQKGASSITPRILPSEWKGGFALLTREEISAIEQPGRYYLSLGVKAPPAATADVTISAVPMGAGIHLCCWTVVKRYERTKEGWRFVRVVGAEIH
jgi:hypothetical protein